MYFHPGNTVSIFRCMGHKYSQISFISALLYVNDRICYITCHITQMEKHYLVCGKTFLSVAVHTGTQRIA